MTLQGGDRKFGHGDELTVKNTSGGEIEAGALLVVTGYDSANESPEVQPANSTDEDDYHAVAGDAIADTAYGEAVFSGAVHVRVNDGAGVTGGQEVAPSSSDGVATDAGSGGTGKGDVFLSDEIDVGGTTYAVVHLG